MYIDIFNYLRAPVKGNEPSVSIKGAEFLN